MNETMTISNELKIKVDNQIDKIMPQIMTIRQYLHQHPHAAWDEHNTAKFIVDTLSRIQGLKVREGVGELGVVALLEGDKPGPTVALRADMDALRINEDSDLPYKSQNHGIMHACGHDGHMANLLGAIFVLHHLRDQLQGRIKFIFQPAEEGGRGALKMCEAGVLEDPRVDVIFGCHVWPDLKLGQIGVKNGTIMAADSHFKLEIRGMGTHAAMPHLGTDQVLIAARIIGSLHDITSRCVSPTEPVVLTFTKINGGSAFNIIPEGVDILGTLRTISSDTTTKLKGLIVKMAQDIAATYGAAASIKFELDYPVTSNHSVSTTFFRQVVRQVCTGEALVELDAPSMGAEDFSYYLKRVPGTFFFLGHSASWVPSSSKPLHHPSFDFNDEALRTGVKIFVHLALNYILNKGF